MQIRVLGSVDVELNGRPVKLAGPKQRAVLSMLALNANATVSLERAHHTIEPDHASTSARDSRVP